MSWIALSYSVPNKSSSNPRVRSWRRLRRLGAISPIGGIHILPAKPECIEAFQWLAQEIRQSGGRAVVLHLEQFDGITDQELVECFREAREADYMEIEQEAIALEADMNDKKLNKTDLKATERLIGLQRQFNEVARIDYFESKSGARLTSRLAKLTQSLSSDESEEPCIESAKITDFKSKRWVTRPKPHVDRLASIWLIRRFIDPKAAIRYAEKTKPGEVSFDMDAADFGHVANLCTFETMIRAFKLNKPGLQRLAEIVHEVDLRDERYFHPEISGVDAILNGWLELGLPDAEIEERGLALFDSLFKHFSARENHAALKR